jgi:hypothetical protein
MTEPYNEDYRLSRQEIEEIKAALIEDDYLVFQARCVKKFGPEGGIFLRQIVFWMGKGDADGWLWKTEAKMEQETGLSRSGQRKARKILTSKGVLEEERKGVPRRMYYRANLHKLMEFFKTPGSTLNQWKVGMKLDKETRMFYRPESETDAALYPEYREDGNTDLISEDGNTDLISEDGSSDPASRDGSSDLAIQRLRQREPQETTSGGGGSRDTVTQERQERHSEQAPHSPPTEQEPPIPLPVHGRPFPRLTHLEETQALQSLNKDATPAGQLLRAHVRALPLGPDGGAVEIQHVAEALAEDLSGDRARAPLYVRSVERFAEAFSEDLRREEVAV